MHRLLGCGSMCATVGRQPTAHTGAATAARTCPLCCLCLQAKYLVVALLTTVVLWARYQPSVSLAAIMTRSTVPERRTLADSGGGSDGSSSGSSSSGSSSSSSSGSSGGSSSGGAGSSSSGNSLGDEPEVDPPDSLLLPLDDAHTLQFDVCNGFTNQRIALMSGGPASQAHPTQNFIGPLAGYRPAMRPITTQPVAPIVSHCCHPLLHD